jgi:hypothetical protein
MDANYIYIGPNSPPLGLQQWNLSFDPEPPFTMKPFIEANPLLRCLYIPTEGLGLARKNLKTNPQSVESLAYKAFASIISKLPR